MERVYHNKNVLSSIATGKVIGLCELLAFESGIGCELFTPQQVKCASGFGSTADKKMLLRVSSRLFGQKLRLTMLQMLPLSVWRGVCGFGVQSKTCFLAFLAKNF